MRSPRSTDSRKTAAAIAIGVAAAAVAGTGVGAAAVKKPPTFKACATKANVLVLLKNGKCAKGTHGVTLGARGPAGGAGATGAKGDTGPAGPGTVQKVSYGLTTNESTGVNHTVATVGPLTLAMQCFDTGTGVLHDRVLLLKGPAVLVSGQEALLGDIFEHQGGDLSKADVEIVGTNVQTVAPRYDSGWVTAQLPDGRVATINLTVVTDYSAPTDSYTGGKCSVNGTVLITP